MSHNALDLAMKAMDCPKALEILNCIQRLAERDVNYSYPTIFTSKTNSEPSLHRLSELEMQESIPAIKD